MVVQGEVRLADSPDNKDWMTSKGPFQHSGFYDVITTPGRLQVFLLSSQHPDVLPAKRHKGDAVCGVKSSTSGCVLCLSHRQPVPVADSGHLLVFLEHTR